MLALLKVVSWLLWPAMHLGRSSVRAVSGKLVPERELAGGGRAHGSVGTGIEVELRCYAPFQLCLW